MKKIKLIAVLMLAISVLVGCSSKPSTDGPSDVVSLEAIVDNVKAAYGEDYVPSMDIDETTLSDLLGVDLANVDQFIGQLPMMSTHVDTFVAIQAKDGKGAIVAEQLSAYRETLVSNSVMYPMNVAKVQASEVLQKGDYVFFIMLGAFDDGSAEDEMIFAKEQTQIGVDAISTFLK